jgi:hypothetical protein
MKNQDPNTDPDPLVRGIDPRRPDPDPYHNVMDLQQCTK